MLEPSSESGRPFGRYLLLRRIARGGMGELHLARLEGAAGWEKQVAIKKILPHLAGEEEFLHRFIDEARIAVSLTHGNIVPVFDLGVVEGEYYIAMEYIDGIDLRRLLRQLRASGHTMPTPVALLVASEVCKGLSYAHGRRDDQGRPDPIVHRDVSPANILLSRDGEVKIVDFGIATARDRLGRTHTGELKGKFGYMSPEQASGDPVDARTDLFALGTVLYEMLGGEKPFDGATDMEVLARVRKAKFRRLDALRPDLSPELVEVVHRLLALDPRDRPASADDVLVSLLQLLFADTGPITATHLGSFVREALDREAAAREAPRSLDDVLSEQLDGALPDGPATGPSRPGGSSRPTGPSQPSARPLLRTGDTPEMARAHGTMTAAPPLARPFWNRRRRRTAVQVAIAAVGFFAAAWFALDATGTFRAAGIRVTSEPTGADVWIDGTLRGKTTFVADLDPGEHRVRVDLDGYNPVEVPVTVRRRVREAVAIQLRPAPRDVTFASIPPGAVVRVDGCAPFPAPGSCRVPVDTPVLVVMQQEGWLDCVATPIFRVDGDPRFTCEMKPWPSSGSGDAVAEPVPDSNDATDAPVVVEARPARATLRDAGNGTAGGDRTAGNGDAGTAARAADAGEPTPGARVEPGTLRVWFGRARPATGEIRIDGTSRGTNQYAAWEVPIAPGTYRVEVVNAASDLTDRGQVEVRAGEVSTFEVDWR